MDNFRDRKEDRMLTPLEVSKRLRIGRSTVYRLIAEGTIPSVRIGASIRVSEKKLNGWIEDQGRGSGNASTAPN